jgi:hypothetical protein
MRGMTLVRRRSSPNSRSDVKDIPQVGPLRRGRITCRRSADVGPGHIVLHAARRPPLPCRGISSPAPRHAQVLELTSIKFAVHKQRKVNLPGSTLPHWLVAGVANRPVGKGCHNSRWVSYSCSKARAKSRRLAHQSIQIPSRNYCTRGAMHWR